VAGVVTAAPALALPGADGPLGRELRVACDLAVAAGVEILKLRRGELGVEFKPGDEPVTIADRRASELIVAGLTAAFPADVVISEELADDPRRLAARRVWYVDPIDGTKDYIRGADGFSVMIGLCDGAVPVLGVVHQPTTGRTYFATPDGGAHVRADDGAIAALVPSTTAAAAAAKLVVSASHRSAAIDEVKGALGIADEANIGSVGLKLCLIAAGVRDLYVNPAAKTKSWDTCAPEAILARVGGRLTDLGGQPISYAIAELGHRYGLVASNGHVHDEVIGRLGPLFAARLAGRAGRADR
jgi:3'(2'), 5'-bisphosphate nucleotidase